MKVKMLTEQIPDAYVRDNFKRLADALDAENILRGNFKFFEIVLTNAVTGFDFPHNLKFTPKDVIVEGISGGATITFHYDNFTTTNIQFTTSAGCTVRCFVGSYSFAN